MSIQTLFIHGFALGIDNFFSKKETHIAGFEAFRDELERGDNSVFYWSKELEMSHWQALNPFAYLQLYFQERSLAQSELILKKLHAKIEFEKPYQIVCHSMGCFVLLQYLKRYTLPASVKSIVFLQADVSEKELRESPLMNKKIQFTNVYRRFDFALWFSSLMHLNVRLGLIKFGPSKGAKTQLRITNRYFPSFAHANTHMAVLYDARLKGL